MTNMFQILDGNFTVLFVVIRMLMLSFNSIGARVFCSATSPYAALVFNQESLEEEKEKLAFNHISEYTLYAILILI